KFQMRHMSSLYRNSGNPDDVSEDLGAQYTLDVLSRSLLSNDQMMEAFEYCRTRNLIPLCTPWDLESVAVLAAFDLAAYKIASADLTNHDLLRAVAATARPMLVSTGMSTEEEIVETTSLLRQPGAAFARGAKIIEKHITLDRQMPGNDHQVSLEPDEFAAMVQAIRVVEEALGDDAPRRPSAGERMNREVLAKSVIAACDISAGAVIDAGMLEVKSPGKGLQPNRRAALVGRRAKRALKAGDFFFASDLNDEEVKPRAYRFRRRWGIPVRYHDWRQLYRDLPMDFLEFHFSFKDLEIDPDSCFDRPLD